METKYIAFHDDNYGVEYVVIFSGYVAHRDMANCLARLSLKPVGAGFVQLGAEGLVCYGRSESLNLNSRPEKDTELARRILPR